MSVERDAGYVPPDSEEGYVHETEEAITDFSGYDPCFDGESKITEYGMICYVHI